MVKQKTIAVVLLYFPDSESLISNISSYCFEVDKVVLWRNSVICDKLKLELERIAQKENIQWMGNGINHGIGYALNKVAEWGLSNGYTHMLTMDQDSYFPNDLFFRAARMFSEKDIAIISPQHKRIKAESGSNIEYTFKEVFIMTSGNIVNLDVWNEIGGFNELFFIDEVDHEFCLRAKQHGKRILKFLNFPLVHNLGVEKKLTIAGMKVRLGFHSKERVYYMVRNGLALCRMYFSIFPWLILIRMKDLIKMVVKILLFQKGRKEWLEYMHMGVKDFLGNKFGQFSRL